MGTARVTGCSVGRRRRGCLTHHAVWLRKISTWPCRLPHVPFPAQGLIPSLLLFTPRRLKRNIPSTAPCDSACLQLGRVSPSAKQELSSLAEQQPPKLPPKILPPPHHAQGVLSENKKGSAAKASLTDTYLRLEFPLERLSGHPGAGPALNREQGFPWILTRLHLDLADATSVLRSWASGPGSESTQGVQGAHLASFSSRNLLSKR